MKSVKPNKLGRRILSFVLTAALVTGWMPGNVLTVKAEESSSTVPSVTAFATPEQLMNSDNFALHTDYRGVAQKVYFGTNGDSQQTWYIAGSDADNSIVLLCDPALPMATGTMFEDDWENNKTYESSWSCIYGTVPSEVYPNHYGASDLRLNTLKKLETDTNIFTTSEQNMMLATKVYTDDDKLKDEGNSEYTYYTEDKLYAAYGDYNDDKYITVGTNSAGSLNGGIKVSLTSAPYNSGDIFWLRAPYYSTSLRALVAKPGYFVSNYTVDYVHSVVPAFRLNLSSVLFASAAPAATSDTVESGTIAEGTAMTLRVDGSGSGSTIAIGEVLYDADKGLILAKKDASAGAVVLVVQGNDGTNDWYYSKTIGGTEWISTTDIGSALPITDISLSDCKIWLETTDAASTSLRYAVMAEAGTFIDSVAITDIDTPAGGTALDTSAVSVTAGLAETDLTVAWTKDSEAEGENADYGTTYTAGITLTPAEKAAFVSGVTATVNGNAATVTPNTDGTVTVTYDFTTAKRKLVSIAAPAVPENNRFTSEYTAENVLASTELGTTVQVTLEGTTEPVTVDMAVEWSLANESNAEYDITSSATNTFKWTVKEDAYAGYDTNNVTLEGTVDIKNACTEHKPACVANEESNTIEAKCGSCGKTLGSVVLTAPADRVYSGEAKEASVSGSIEGITEPAVVYAAAEGSSLTDGKPVNAGNYTASISMGEGTAKVAASVDFTIEPRNITGATVGEFAAMTYDGTAQTPVAEVTLASGSDSSFTVTGSWSEVANVSDTTTFTANGNFTGTIANQATGMAAKEISVSSATIANVGYNAAGNYALEVTGVTFDGVAAGDELAMNTDYTATAVMTGENKIADGVAAEVTVTLENRNYTLSQSTVAATVNIVEHSHVWNYTAEGATITASCESTLGDCTVDGKNVYIEVMAPSGDLTYDGTAKTATASMSALNIFANPVITYSAETGGTLTDGKPVNAGSYTASISMGEGTAKVTASVDFTMEKAATAPNIPESTQSVSFATKTVGAVTLPTGWVWEDSSKALTVGAAVTATAVYNGADKGNYETETVEIFITRAACTHTGKTEVRDVVSASQTQAGYTGDTWCLDCETKIATGTEIPKQTPAVTPGGSYYPPYTPSYPTATPTPVPTATPAPTEAPSPTPVPTEVPSVTPTVAPPSATPTPVPGTVTVPTSGETVVNENGEEVTSVVQEPGTTMQLSIPGITDVTGENAAQEDGAEAVPVVWESTNPDVAEVDENGNITMKEPGLAEIVVTVGEGEDAKTETIVVLVEEPRTYKNPLEEAFKDVRLGTSWADIPLIRYQKVGETVDINFYGVKNWKKDNYEYAWQISDESIATVDNKGRVTALKPGVVELILGLKNKTTGQNLNVQSVKIVIPGNYEDKILLGTSRNNTFESLVLNLNERIDINFYGVKNWKKDDFEYYWSSSEPSVVWVDNLGRLTPVNPGTAEVFLVLVEKKNGAPRYVVPVTVTVPEK